MEVQAFKIRWFVENCCEIKLPSGKTILIDPMLSKDKDSDNFWMKAFYSGFGVEDLEGCDYILISHAHGDHIASLAEVFDKYHAPIVVNHTSAYPLALHEDIAPGAFIPICDGTELNFGEFKVKMLPGRHTAKVASTKPSQSPIFGDDPEEVKFGVLGSLYNNNYLITLKNNFRIALDSGLYESDLSEWEKYQPNLILRHFDRGDDHLKNYVDIFRRSGAEYILTLCSQGQAPTIEERQAINDQVNTYCAEHGIHGRSILPKAGQWMTFHFGYTVED